MDALDSMLDSFEEPKNKKNCKKGKWREIEQLKDKFQLEKDLKSYEYSLEYMLDEF